MAHNEQMSLARAKLIADACMNEAGDIINTANRKLVKLGYILAISTVGVGEYAWDLRKIVKEH